jgi:N-methylhydantoinase B
MTGLDPITLEVVRNGIEAAVEEMRVIVMRSARSPLLKEAGDLSCVITDATGQLIAQGSQDIPTHLGLMGHTVKEFLRRVPADRLRDGDVWFTNSPEVGGNHLPDVKAIKPVFHVGRLVAFTVSLTHWPDIGGALPGSYVPWATEIYQEGLHIPPIRLYSADGPERDTIALVLANVRGGAEREGDIHAQRAACEVAARRVLELIAQHGAETVAACYARMTDESEALMRAAIAAIPDGAYVGEDWLDSDGIDNGPFPIRATVRISGDMATVDYGGTSPAVRGFINSTPFIARSAAYYVLKALLAPQAAANDGCYRPIQVVVPTGTILSPGPSAPIVAGNHETSHRCVDAVMRAMANAVPDRVVAGGVATAGLLIISGARASGDPFVLYEVHGGGGGARATADGDNGVRVHMSNVMNTPAEAIEHEYPIIEECHELRDGSGGGGRFHGGLGIRRSYRLLADGGRLTTVVERVVTPPWGLRGGQPGQAGAVTIRRRGDSISVGGMATVGLERDDVVTIETCGGGAVGAPGA